MPWDCVCGATGIEAAYCAWCGRWAPVPAPAYPAPYAPPWDPSTPPRRRGLGTVVAGGVAASVALVVAVAAVGAFLDSRVGVDDGRTRVHSAAFDAGVADLKAFVEREHGGPFRGRVTIETLSGEAFVDEVLAGEDDDPFSDTLTGLGLAEGEDPDQVRADLLASEIVGLYDHFDDVLYVRGEELTPYARLVLVHELAHAWQDQQYDLDSVYERAESADAERAIRALIEGDATRVERAWERAQPPEVRQEIDRAEEPEDVDAGEAEDLTVAEQSTAALLDFSYDIGTTFVDRVFKTGGNAAITAAFHDPPVSTEQVLHPERYLSGDVPQPVSRPLPPEGATELDTDVLGEAGLALFVARGQPDVDALAAVRGWDGDRYTTWRVRNGPVCTQDDLAMETAAQRDRLLRLLRAKDLGPGGRVEPVGARRLSVVSCATA